MSTSFIIIPRGVIVISGNPTDIAFAGNAIGLSVMNSMEAAGSAHAVMTALEVTDLAKSAVDAARDSDPTLGSMKLLGSAAFGAAVGAVTVPIITPVGGAAFGFMAGKIYEEIFDWMREQSGNLPWTTDIPQAPGRGLFDTSKLDPDTLLPIDPNANTAFNAARGGFARRDPLVLDLDGDGIEAVGIDPAHPILFDHDGDGVKNATDWAKTSGQLLSSTYKYNLNASGSLQSVGVDGIKRMPPELTVLTVYSKTIANNLYGTCCGGIFGMNFSRHECSINGVYRSVCVHRLTGSTPRRSSNFLSRRRKKVTKGHTVGICSLRAAKLCEYQRATLVPVRPGRTSTAVLSLGGVSLNSLRSNRREPLSAQHCATRHGHKGTRVKSCGVACTPRARRMDEQTIRMATRIAV